MYVNRINFMSFPAKPTFIPKPEIRQYVQGDYITIVEIFPDKQIRTLRNIKKNKIINVEILDNLV